MKSILVGMKNVLLWSYGRGTWQYDALCIGIVLAVFLIPSRYFGDRDRTIQANEIELHASDKPGKAAETYIEADALNAFLKEQNRTELSRTPKDAMQLYWRGRIGKNVAIVNIEPFINPDGKMIYKVWYK